MEIQSFIANFEDAIADIPAGSITPGTEFQQLPERDSMEFLSLLAMIDMEYAVEIDGAKWMECRTVAELFALIAEQR